MWKANDSERWGNRKLAGEYAGWLRMGTGANEFGGGRAIRPSLASLFRFNIHGIAPAA